MSENFLSAITQQQRARLAEIQGCDLGRQLQKLGEREKENHAIRSGARIGLAKN